MRPDFQPLEPLLGHKQKSHPSHLALIGGHNWAMTKRLLAVNIAGVGMPLSLCERRWKTWLQPQVFSSVLWLGCLKRQKPLSWGKCEFYIWNCLVFLFSLWYLGAGGCLQQGVLYLGPRSLEKRPDDPHPDIHFAIAFSTLLQGEGWVAFSLGWRLRW